MPLVAYFRNVGAALFALLVLADFYLPAAPAVQGGTAAYSPAIRIHSARKLPEPVVFDMTQVVFAAATSAPWDRNPPAPPARRVDTSGVRDAFALLPRTDSHRVAAVDQKKRQPTRKYAARRHANPQTVLVARQGQFPWFGFSHW